MTDFKKNTQILNFVKICPGDPTFPMRTDGHDEANSFFRKFVNTPKNSTQSKYRCNYKVNFLMLSHLASRWTGKQMSP